MKRLKRSNHNDYIFEKYDSLTGLVKYDYFVSELDNLVSEFPDTNLKLAFVYTDIKHFKYINEAFGYNIGNELLRLYADLAATDSPLHLGTCRVYSDNFISVINIASLTEEEFIDSINSTNRVYEEKAKALIVDRNFQINTGVYILKDSFHEDLSTAISNANYARKQAKMLNSRKCVVFDDSMMNKVIHKMELCSAFPNAIATGEIQVYYQPKVDSITKKVIGAEALVRWIKKDGSFIFPDQFIPALEENGLIIDLDYYVYRQVFKYIKSKLDNGIPVVPISMNVSRTHFRDDDLSIYVDNIFKEFPIPTKYVEFELTESIYIENMNTILPFVNKMRELGIKISMDDFGSGYSSLNLLNNLPIDIMKLDRAFLGNDNLSNSQRIILSHIISMAKQLGIEVLCEGVETKSQSDFLEEAGCDMFQGYYFSRPINQTAFDKYLNQSMINS